MVIDNVFLYYKYIEFSVIGMLKYFLEITVTAKYAKKKGSPWELNYIRI
ncbi:hypothetical protein I600_28 [Maribacter dokdonensis DSW-8]|nr:hypothetical protein I600_28 [Maribacter dokdonensis DSW-8]